MRTCETRCIGSLTDFWSTWCIDTDIKTYVLPMLTRTLFLPCSGSVTPAIPQATFSYMFLMRTSHSLTPSLRRSHQIAHLATQLIAFSGSKKSMHCVLLTAWNFSCSWHTNSMTPVVSRLGMKPNCMLWVIISCHTKFYATLYRGFLVWSNNHGRR